LHGVTCARHPPHIKGTEGLRASLVYRASVISERFQQQFAF
jgi:hypothetical protein